MNKWIRPIQFPLNFVSTNLCNQPLIFASTTYLTADIWAVEQANTWTYVTNTLTKVRGLQANSHTKDENAGNNNDFIALCSFATCITTATTYTEL
jgi:hypothetical protein